MLTPVADSPRDSLTMSDLLRIGACAVGVFGFCQKNGVRSASINLQAALGLAAGPSADDRDARDWIVRAAGVAGRGDCELADIGTGSTGASEGMDGYYVEDLPAGGGIGSGLYCTPQGWVSRGGDGVGDGSGRGVSSGAYSAWGPTWARLWRGGYACGDF